MPEFLSRKDRRTVESFLNLGEDVTLGVVKIDREKCSGCGLCTKACAGAALEIDVDKKCRMVEEMPFCMSCGDCVAICKEDAIELVQFIQFHKAFRYLDRGDASPPRKF